MTSQHGKAKRREKERKEISSYLAKTAVERKSERGKLGSYRVSTCWEIADSLAVRDYCHIKKTIKIKETGPAELMGSQLGLPGEQESIARRKCSRRPHRGAVYHLESAFVSFSSGKRYISSVKCSMSWFSPPTGTHCDARMHIHS